MAPMHLRQTTTADPPSADAFILLVGRSERGWQVRDTVTTRFGSGETLEVALADYAEDLRSLTMLDGPFGPPLKVEVEWAREVFRP